jgi:hypothetical protein
MGMASEAGNENGGSGSRGNFLHLRCSSAQACLCVPTTPSLLLADRLSDICSITAATMSIGPFTSHSL